MSQIVCCAIGEINDYLGKGCDMVGDVVTGKSSDVIVYPHVDSCLAAIFLLKCPSGGIDRVGTHIAVTSDHYVGYENALKYYAKHSLLKQHSAKTNAYFIADDKSWNEPIKEILKPLNVEAYYYNSFGKAVNVWVNGNNVHLAPWIQGATIEAA
ncbi:MAG: hypothetical protein RQ760_13330, partial [Sedimentisphaerales bacterium]|nr:hypothetical protein [Sedimentisphaerales bacterium]